MKVFTVAIIGCGSRGGFVYAKLMNQHKDKYKIVALCDMKQAILDLNSETYNVPKENCFLSEEEFFKAKRADILVIATQDKDHVRMANKALELGYDILLEKPISPDKNELLSILENQKKYGGKVVVCHVLRYAPAYLKIKEILDSGVIGELVRLEALEQVAYWHQAHSFVRGNWRNSEETSPMIMAKCCHDLDMIQYFVGSRCDTVFSTGSLRFFNKAHQPEGASDRCKDCKYKMSCIYSAENLYCTKFEEENCTPGWPYNVVESTKYPFNTEDLRKAYESNQYGRCVFTCDNDVVDNQQVEMTFENGVNASLTMTAFTAWPGRRMVFHGTSGEIIFDEHEDILRVNVFNGHFYPKTEEWSVKELTKKIVDSGFGHGGGDQLLVAKLYDIVSGNVDGNTTLDKSIESHLMALAAEESRLTNKVVKVHDLD